MRGIKREIQCSIMVKLQFITEHYTEIIMRYESRVKVIEYTYMIVRQIKIYVFASKKQLELLLVEMYYIIN